MSEKPPTLTYDQLEPEERIYLFEFIFPEAARLVMAANEITAYTDFVDPELQKERPRVEVTFIPGSGQGRFRRVNGQPLESAWAGAFHFSLITASDPVVHGRFVSKVRALIHRLGGQINAVEPMQLHKLADYSIDGGTSNTVKAEEGYFETTITLNVNVSVQDDAWALITTT